MTFQLAIAILALAAVIAIVAPHDRLLWRRRRVVIIHTKDGQSIQGFLVSVVRFRSLVLERPEYLEGVRPAGIGGYVVIPWSNFSWCQDAPAEALAAAGVESDRPVAVS